jgi:hypothetical protein
MHSNHSPMPDAALAIPAEARSGSQPSLGQEGWAG